MPLEMDVLAEIIADTAKDVADKSLDPVNKKITAAARSLANAERISREAIDAADALKIKSEEIESAVTEEREERISQLNALREEHKSAVELYADAIGKVTAAQKNMSDVIAGINEPIESGMSAVYDKIMERTDKVASELRDLKAISVERISAVSTIVSEIERIDGELKEIPAEVDSKISEVKKEHGLKMSGLSDSFSELKKYVSSNIEEMEKSARRSEVTIDQLKAYSEEKLSQIENGAKGEVGDRGPRGPKGPPGTMATPERWTKDSLFKTGATVIHRGGTWYCEVTTVDEPGDTPAWTLIANGIDKDSCYSEDGIYSLVFSDGSTQDLRVLPRHKGGYTASEKYIKSDTVTNRGSWYQALVDNPTQTPGKKLKDGEKTQWAKIVARGAKGEKGDPGDPKDAAAMVYEQMQKDLAEAAAEIDDFLDGVGL